MSIHMYELQHKSFIPTKHNNYCGERLWILSDCVPNSSKLIKWLHEIGYYEVEDLNDLKMKELDFDSALSVIHNNAYIVYKRT